MKLILIAAIIFFGCKEKSKPIAEVIYVNEICFECDTIYLADTSIIVLHKGDHLANKSEN